MASGLSVGWCCIFLLFFFFIGGQSAPFFIYNEVIEGYDNSGYQLLKIDLATNALVLNTELGIKGFDQGTYNAKTGQVYFMRRVVNTTTYLINTIDSNTGNVTANLTMPIPSGWGCEFMFYDEEFELLIFGFTYLQDKSMLLILGIDPIDGTQIKLFSGSLDLGDDGPSHISSATYNKDTHTILLLQPLDDYFRPRNWTSIALITLASSSFLGGSTIQTFNITSPGTQRWVGCYHSGQSQSILGLSCSANQQCALVGIDPSANQTTPRGPPAPYLFDSVGRW